MSEMAMEQMKRLTAQLNKLAQISLEREAASEAGTAANRRWNAARAEYARVHAAVVSEFGEDNAPVWMDSYHGPRAHPGGSMNPALDSRARFEATMASKGFSVEILIAGYPNLGYDDPCMDAAWEAWQAAIASTWTNVRDAIPPCRDDQLYLGVNSNGYAGVFNAVADIAGDVHCMYETAEESVDVMSGLAIWQPFNPPTPPTAALAAKETT